MDGGQLTSGYGEKYHGLIRCRPISISLIFFMRVTLSWPLSGAARLPVVRGFLRGDSFSSWVSVTTAVTSDSVPRSSLSFMSFLRLRESFFLS